MRTSLFINSYNFRWNSINSFTLVQILYL